MKKKTEIKSIKFKHNKIQYELKIPTVRDMIELMKPVTETELFGLIRKTRNPLKSELDVRMCNLVKNNLIPKLSDDQLDMVVFTKATKLMEKNMKAMRKLK